MPSPRNIGNILLTYSFSVPFKTDNKKNNLLTAIVGRIFIA